MFTKHIQGQSESAQKMIMKMSDFNKVCQK